MPDPDPPFTDHERVVLRLLLEHDRQVEDTTYDALAHAAAREGLERRDVRRALDSLENRQPPFVISDVDAGLDKRVWAATLDGGEALEDSGG